MNGPRAGDAAVRFEALSLPWSLRRLRRLPLPRKLGLLERLYGAWLAKQGIRWVECANGRVWKLDLADATHRWCVYGDYEGSVQMDWIRSWLAGGGVVVDSGASIGQMVMYLGAIPGVTVHAFEPTSESRAWLSESVQRNGYRNVLIQPCGLSNEPQRRLIHTRGCRSTLWLESGVPDPASHEAVELMRLDDYLSDRSIAHLRLWKLDVERHECPALAGASQMLKARAIDAILIELSHFTFRAVKAQLEAAGYQLWRLEGRGRSRVNSLTQPGSCNLVALPDEAVSLNRLESK